MRRRERYIVDGVDMFSIRNRNETRVADCIREELRTMIDQGFTDKDLLDIYTYSLNQLPARYTLTGTMVLRDPVSKEDVCAVVREAFEHVTKNPKD